jgi:hypothetical protein
MGQQSLTYGTFQIEFDVLLVLHSLIKAIIINT